MAGSVDANKLTTAAARGDLKEIEMMLLTGPDVNEKNMFGRTPLQVMKLGNPAIADALLRANADPNVRDPIGGLTITHDAARDGYLDTLNVLIQHGADVNAADDDGNLPLHLGAREGHLGVVQFLAQHTANPFQHNKRGETPSDLAKIHNRSVTAQWLETFMHLQSD